MQEYQTETSEQTEVLQEPEITYITQQHCKTSGYIDAMNDWAFKKLFCSEENPEILISFLNTVLEGKREISTLTYSKNEHLADRKETGTAVIDIACTDPQGNHFLIEVQKSRQKFFKDRTLFYASRLISNQAPKGSKRIKWNYELKDVYIISILEHFVLDPGENPDYCHQVSLINNTTGKLFYEKLGFTYIELRKFDKKEGELVTDLDKWLYALKHMKALKSKPASFTEPELEKLFNMANFANLTAEEMNMYYESQKVRWDNQNALDYAEETGIEQGKREKALEMAKEMLADGFSIDQIIKYTKLSKADIASL